MVLIQGHRGHHRIWLLSFHICSLSFICMSCLFRPPHLSLEGEGNFPVSLLKSQNGVLEAPISLICVSVQLRTSHERNTGSTDSQTKSCLQVYGNDVLGALHTAAPSISWGWGYVQPDLSREVGGYPKPYAGFLLPPEGY